MNYSTFSEKLDTIAGPMVSEMFQMPDLPRFRVPEFVQKFEKFLQDDIVSSLFVQIIDRLKFLGESAQNIRNFNSMLVKLRKPFDKFRTEWLALEFFKEVGT